MQLYPPSTILKDNRRSHQFGLDLLHARTSTNRSKALTRETMEQSQHPSFDHVPSHTWLLSAPLVQPRLGAKQRDSRRCWSGTARRRSQGCGCPRHKGKGLLAACVHLKILLYPAPRCEEIEASEGGPEARRAAKRGKFSPEVLRGRSASGGEGGARAALAKSGWARWRKAANDPVAPWGQGPSLSRGLGCQRAAANPQLRARRLRPGAANAAFARETKADVGSPMLRHPRVSKNCVGRADCRSQVPLLGFRI